MSKKAAEKGPSGLTQSDDIALHVEYMKTIPTKVPNIPVTKEIQRQRERRVGHRKPK